uniref:DUF4371 domain-containing protein n=1 Tax=Octopus bimaculoides TaxID=37653 RepID=A0A0L8I0C4_OCTBM
MPNPFSSEDYSSVHVLLQLKFVKRPFPIVKKLTYIIQDRIAHSEQNEILEILKKQKFSLLIDESSDISVTQILAIVVCFFDKQSLNVKDALLDEIVSTLTKDVSMSNILGFASDNCSTMMGNKSGFQKLMGNDNPTLFTTDCVYHSFALCSSHAVKVLPSYLESLLKDLTSYFSRSSKRQNDFNMIQSVVGTKENKIPKLSQTRWLSQSEHFRLHPLHTLVSSEHKKILDPKVGRDLTNSPQSIIPLASNFPAIAPENTLDELDNEWRLFRQYKDSCFLKKRP